MLTDFTATMDRRILTNYRVDPEFIARLLPLGLRPQLVDGSAVAGICALRLTRMRPLIAERLPLGPYSEGAAHRIAVEWDDAQGDLHRGVYVPVRHNASRVAVAIGGRLVPGVHRLARFTTTDAGDRFTVTADADDVHIDLDVHVTTHWSSSLFPTLADVSDFFRTGSVAYSPGRDGSLEGLRLVAPRWSLQAATATRHDSSFFEALGVHAEFDSAVLMRGLPTRWSAPSEVAPDRIQPMTRELANNS